MKNIKKMAAMLLIVMLSSSCVLRFDRKMTLELLEKERACEIMPNKVYVTADTVVGNFSGIVITGISEVEFVQDNVSPHIQFFGSDNIVPLVKAEVKDSVLTLSWKDGKRAGEEDLKVTVYAPSLSLLTTIGSVDFKCTHLEEPDMEFAVVIAGSGDAEFGHLVSGSLSVNLAGSSDVEFGRVLVDDIQIVVAGSGDLDMKGIDAETIEVSVAGSGEVALEGTAETSVYSVYGSGGIDSGKVKCPDTSTDLHGSGSIIYQGADGKRIVE